MTGTDEANKNYDSVTHAGEINIDEWWLDSYFSFASDGKRHSFALSEEGEDVLFGLVFSLHEEIKNYTGGEWTTFTLTIGKDGKAKASFEYPEE